MHRYIFSPFLFFLFFLLSEILYNFTNTKFFFSDILRQRTRDVEVKRYCIQLLEKLGSFKYTRETLSALDKEARLEVVKLGPNTFMENLLNDLFTWSDPNDVNNML